MVATVLSHCHMEDTDLAQADFDTVTEIDCCAVNHEGRSINVVPKQRERIAEHIHTAFAQAYNPVFKL